VLATIAYPAKLPAMFIKLTESRGHRYVQLVESFRDDEGKSRQRTIAIR